MFLRICFFGLKVTDIGIDDLKERIFILIAHTDNILDTFCDILIEYGSITEHSEDNIEIDEDVLSALGAAYGMATSVKRKNGDGMTNAKKDKKKNFSTEFGAGKSAAEKKKKQAEVGLSTIEFFGSGNVESDTTLNITTYAVSSFYVNPEGKIQAVYSNPSTRDTTVNKNKVNNVRSFENQQNKKNDKEVDDILSGNN